MVSHKIFVPPLVPHLVDRWTIRWVKNWLALKCSAQCFVPYQKPLMSVFFQGLSWHLVVSTVCK